MTSVRLGAALLAVALAASHARAGWWDDAASARRTTLEELRRDPERWRDVVVLVEVGFLALSDARPPDTSQFSTGTWRGVAVRAAGADTFVGAFVEEGSAGERRLRDVPAGRRVQLRASVREVVGGDPRLEVFEVVADGDPLSPEETALAERGDHLLAQDNPAAAEHVLRELAGRRTLPRDVQVRIWRQIGEACWSQRHLADSVSAFAAAVAADPDDAGAAARLAAAKAAVASAPRMAADASRPEEAPLPPVPVIPKKLLPPSGLTATAAPETPPEEPPPPPPGAPETPQEKLVERPGAKPAEETPPAPPRPPLSPPR